jgi:hypothetical protein
MQHEMEVMPVHASSQQIMVVFRLHLALEIMHQMFQLRVTFGSKPWIPALNGAEVK